MAELALSLDRLRRIFPQRLAAFPCEDASMLTLMLLLVSNVFMTFAWYGHLHHKDRPLWVVILVSWLIAFFEYCFQVPANRLGHGQFSAAQLKIMQEAITIVVFCGFSLWYLGEKMRWNYLVGFACIMAAVFFVFVVDRPEPVESSVSHRATP